MARRDPRPVAGPLDSQGKEADSADLLVRLGKWMQNLSPLGWRWGRSGTLRRENKRGGGRDRQRQRDRD